jgi:hypothetical protein
MSTLLRLAFILIAATPLACRAQGHDSRVVAMGGRVTIEIPAGWEYVEKGHDCLVGPKGMPFVNLGYFQASPENQSTLVDRSFAREFVQNNLKVAKSENLAGGRVFAHAVERVSGSEHHQWNVAKIIDARHIAVLLIGMQTGLDHAKIVSMVDRLARSVQFVPPKKAV